MRVAALQLPESDSAAHDQRALIEAVAEAERAGADLIACPCLPRLKSRSEVVGRVREAVRAAAGLATVVLPCSGIACGEPGPADEAAPAAHASFGSLAVLCGDETLDAAMLDETAKARPTVLVLQVEGESPLQSEALREYAITLSERVSSLVLVTSRSGDPGAAEGGAAIVYAGDVLAEAGDGPAVLTAEIVAPLLPPESPGTAFAPPPLLAERFDTHRGEKTPVDYPADLS